MRSTHRRAGIRRLRKPEPLEARRLLAVFNVNTTQDTVDADLTDDLALDADGNTSLRAAVMQANASPGDDSINLPAGTYWLSITSPPGSTSGDDSFDDLDVTDSSGSLNIIGSGATSTIVDASGIFSRAFQITELGQLSLASLSVTGGIISSGPGAGIYSEGSLALSGVHVYANSGDLGGGVFHTGGALTIDQSTLSGNSASSGGGLTIGAGPLGGGGAIVVTNSTISGNDVLDVGGGLFVESSVTQTIDLQHVTIANNSAPTGAGVTALNGTAAPVNVMASIITDNLSASDDLDVSGLFTSQGSNVIGRADDSSGFIDGSLNDIVGSPAASISAGLAPLEIFSGSPTPVHRLFSTSLAVDHVDFDPPAIVIDQRGRSRLSDAAPDAGAFEFVGGTLLIEAFHDINRNGVFDSGESLAAFDVFVQLTLGGSGQGPIAGSVSGTTTFPVSRLDPGSYSVQADFLSVAQVLGTKLTAFGSVLEEEASPIDPLGGYRYGEIHGEKFRDLLGDGVNNSDPPLEGIRFDLTELGPDMMLGTDDDTLFNPTFSDVNGRFSFTRLVDGNYVVRETVPAGTLVTTGAIPVLEVAAGRLFVPNQGFVQPDSNQVETIVNELSVGNALDAEIRGRVFFDSDLNGFDMSDPGIATFELTLRGAGNDGVFGSGDDTTVLTAVSMSDGSYAFRELAEAGLYRLSVLSKEHYFSTTLTTVEFEVRAGDLILSDPGLGEPPLDGQTVVVNPNLAFGVMRFTAVFGLTFDDLNADGLRQTQSGDTEPPRAEQTVDLYQSLAQSGFGLVASVTSSASPPAAQGTFVLDDLEAGTYALDQFLPVERGLTTSETPFDVNLGTVYVAPSADIANSPSFPLDDFEEGIVQIETLDRLELGSRELVEWTGNIVDDLNADGMATVGESGLEGWTVVIARTERQYVPDQLPSVRSAVTDANGDYAFRVWPGVYQVAEVLPPGFEPTGPRYRFEEFAGFMSGSGSSVSKVSGVALADLNDDQIDDFIVANDFADIVDRTSSIDVFYSQPDGSRSRIELPLGTAMRPQHVVATDLDNDQDADLVVAAIGNGVLDPNSPTNLAYGDVIVFRNDGGTLNRLDEDGNIAMSPPRDGNATRPVDQAIHGNSPSHVSVGFLNDDELADLVVTNLFSYDPESNPTIQHAEDVSVILQTAPGIFAKQQTIDLSNTTIDAQVISTTIADFDGDGNQDIAVGSPGLQSIELFFGSPTGDFNSSSDRRLQGLTKPSHLLAHDLDANDLPDLIVADYAANEILIYHQTTNGLSEQPVRLPTTGKPQWLAIGDLNDDESPDIAVSHASTNVVQPIFNLGDGQYVPSGESEAGSNLRFSAIAPNGFDVAFGKVAIGRVNDDAFNDVVVAQFTSGVTTHTNLAQTLQSWWDSHPDSDAVPLLGTSPFEDFPGLDGPDPPVVPSGQVTAISHSSTITIAQFDDPNFEQHVQGPDFANHFTGSATPSVSNQVLAVPGVQRPHHNYAMPLDVNGDTQVTPLDVLLIVNTINNSASNADWQLDNVDVSGDGQITPVDVLLVVNSLNAQGIALPLYSGTQQASLADIEILSLAVIERFVASGLSQTQADDLGNLTWEVADLPGNVIARTVTDTIYVDVNAAGWGWFVEREPLDERAFPAERDAAFLGQVDLLSTIAHELGHALGLSEDLDEASIMYPRLSLGERRVSAQNIDRLLAELADAGS